MSVISLEGQRKLRCLNPRLGCKATDLLSATPLRAVLRSAGPTGPGPVTLPLQKPYFTACVAPRKSMKYLRNKTLPLRGKRDGTNRSSDITRVKHSHITKSWESAADVGSCGGCWVMYQAADVPLPWDLGKWLLICTPLYHWKTVVL